jgi:acyloxyacyl hydrolase
MTTNDTVRFLTEQYAEMLSGLVKNVTETYTFKNFDMVYADFPFAKIIEKWVAMGGEPWELIEPIDGFHINQYAHALYGDALWEFLEQNRPEWLGPVNPNNDMITSVFNDQGGY